MTSNIAGLIREGVAAFKAGRREEARKLLSRATELDDRNEEAWLWLSAVVDTLENQQICLENVLAINPNNTRALEGLEMINRQLARRQKPPAEPSSPPAEPSPGPFSVGVSGVPPQQATASPDPFAAPPAPSADSFDLPAEKETAGYHGSGRNVPQPSDDEYDAWVAGLNLGGDNASGEAAIGASSDPFNFDSGPFQGPEVSSEPFVEADEMLESPSGFGDIVSPGQEMPDRGVGTFDPFALPQSDSFDATYEEPAVDAFITDEFGEMAGGSGSFASATPFAEAADIAVQDANDLKQFLDYIPEGIKATHLPGEGRQYPLATLIGLAVVGVGTLAALIVMVVLLTSL